MADAENQPFNPGSWREERTADAPQAPTEQPSDDKPKCLSSLDGSHEEFKREVQKSLNDPDSFEHVETRIGSIGPNGAHLMKMDFRARNAFGALILSTATARVWNDDCEAELIYIE